MIHARQQAQENQTAQPRAPGNVARSEPEIDSILAESFPASDPPAWTPGRDVQPGWKAGAREKEPANLTRPVMGGRAIKWGNGAAGGWSDRQRPLVV